MLGGIQKGATMAENNDINESSSAVPEPNPEPAPAQEAETPVVTSATNHMHTQNPIPEHGHSNPPMPRDGSGPASAQADRHTAHQTTVPRPEAAQYEPASSAFGYGAATSEAAATSPHTPPKRNRATGVLLAGLAAGAIIGGIVGGGVSAIVSSNAAPGGATVAQPGGTVTLNNAETATEISGVAMVATPSVVTLSVQSSNSAGSGSGVIYSEDGYIITNAHVVTLDGAAADAKIRVKLSDGRVFDGELVGVAPYSDIAVLKIDAEGLQPIEVADSSDVNVGDLAVAIGAPMNLSNTVTSGVVSALNRGISVGSALIPQDPNVPDEEVPDDQGNGFPWDFRFDTPGEDRQSSAGGQVTLPVIQTDASINPGNSGGALLNGKGELIGVNVAIASPGATEDSASSAGLGFAIPSELATRVADEIIAGEKPSHGMLGASVVDSSYDTDADANHTGGLIKEIVPGAAAAKAGLKVGDVITAVNGTPAADGTSVSALVRMQAGGSEITIDYTRNGVSAQVTTELGTLDW